MTAEPRPAPARPPAEAESGWHPLELLRILRRRRWPFAAAVVLSLLAAALVTLRTERQFRAGSSVLIERQTPRTGTLQDLAASDIFNQDYYQTQYRILQSRTLAERTMEKLDLRRRDPFARAQDPVEEFLRRLDVAPVRNSRIVNVSFELPDPGLAANVANTLVREYIADSVQRRVASLREVNAQLQKESEDLQRKLDDSERALQRFHQEHQLASADDKRNIATQRLDDAVAALGRAEEELSRLRALAELADRGNGDAERFFGLKGIAESKLIQDLALEEARVKHDLADRSKRFKPQHPDVVSLQARLDDVRRAIDQEVARLVAGIRAQVDETATRVESARIAVEARKREKLDLDRLISEADVLKRTRDANKALYEKLLQSIKESEVSSGLEINNISVVDAAIPPTKPSKPNLPLNGALGLGAGLLLAAGLVALLERIDVSIKSPEEVEELLGLPLVGLIPKVAEKDGAAETVALREPKAGPSEAFRALRTALLLSPLHGDARRKLLVTSSGPGEGKTCTSLNLAATLAQGGHRTLLVDADFHRPQMHKHLGLSNERGFSDALVSDEPLAAFVQVVPAAPNLSVVTTGPTPPQPSELLGSPRLAARLSEALAGYDRIVIDTPPVCAVTDACVAAPHVDAVLLVLQPGLTDRSGAKRSLELLSGVGVRPVGAVVNRLASGGEGYYYRYGDYSAQSPPVE